MATRIVNLRFMCCGLHFDAAIDCDWVLHAYGSGYDNSALRDKMTPVELYCFDKPDWDIRMCFYKDDDVINCNEQQNERRYIINTLCDMDFIKNEARKWVREMRKTETK